MSGENGDRSICQFLFLDSQRLSLVGIPSELSVGFYHPLFAAVGCSAVTNPTNHLYLHFVDGNRAVAQRPHGPDWQRFGNRPLECQEVVIVNEQLFESHATNDQVVNISSESDAEGS